MSRLPSAMAVAWKAYSVPSDSVTRPRPRVRSKEATRPRCGPAAGRGPAILSADPSVHDLGERELQDVAGALVAQGRDQRVDAGLGHDGLERVGPATRELRNGRAPHGGQDAEHGIEVLRRDVELDQHLAPGLERALEQREDLLH